MSNVMTLVCRSLVLSPAQKAVLMCIADYAHDDGTDWHSIAAYCAWTCLCKTAVLEALKALEVAGLIVVERRSGARSTTTLQAEALAAAASQTGASAGPVRLPDRSVSRTTPVRLPDRTGAFAGPEALDTSQASTKARERAPAFDAGAIELPEWLPREAWADWVADRNERRKPITGRAAKQQLAKLSDYRDQGHDPVAVINNSIANGYQGLFPPATSRAHSAPSVADPMAPTETFATLD